LLIYIAIGLGGVLIGGFCDYLGTLIFGILTLAFSDDLADVILDYLGWGAIIGSLAGMGLSFILSSRLIRAYHTIAIQPMTERETTWPPAPKMPGSTEPPHQ